MLNPENLKRPLVIITTLQFPRVNTWHKFKLIIIFFTEYDPKYFNDLDILLIYCKH